MATPKKLTVYNISPRDQEETKIAVFRLEDGDVHAEYFGDDEDDKARHEAMLDGVIDSKTGHVLTTDDGTKFMKMLPLAWQNTSFVSVRED